MARSLALGGMLTAVLLVGAQAQGLPTTLPAISYCQQIKSVAARQPCSESLKVASDGNIPLSATLMRMAVAAAPKEGAVRMLLARARERLRDVLGSGSKYFSDVR